jgi:predicted RNA-binding protein with PIN domain
MAEPTLYLFDGYNVLHAGTFSDVRELVDTLASFVAVRGARGVVVFDGVGTDVVRGALEVRYGEHADAVLERLAAENRNRERVCLVSSDSAVRGTSGQEVMKLSSQAFVADLTSVQHQDPPARGLGPRLDDETRERLERLRRGRSE